jgi:hypothetical protein
MKTKEKQQTTPETPPVAVATAAQPQAVVDPAAVLTERTRRKVAEAWAVACRLIQQSAMSEANVLTCADALEACGLSAQWIQPLRLAIALQ